MATAATEPPAEPYWTQIPVQHMIPNHIQTNPINHMHQQQMHFDMEMHRRQQLYATEYKQNFSPIPIMSDLYNMTRDPMHASAPLYSQEMVDDSATRRFQHERYLQQAREMIMADQQAEQMVKTRTREILKDASSRETHEVNINQARFMNRNSYRAVMRNGELVEAEDGYLMVTHTNMVVNSVQAPLDMSNTSTKDTPLNLSVKDEMTTTHHHHLKSDSGYTHRTHVKQDSSSANNLVTKDASFQGVNKIQARGLTILLPPALGVAKLTKLLPKIAPKPSLAPKPLAEWSTAVQPKDEMLKEDAKDVPLNAEPTLSSSPTLLPDVQTLFPHLKTTNSGSLVLWNFLWALLKDENYKKIVTWISFTNFKFCIVNPSMLATLWGQVKQNPSMDWSKIKKILDLYLRKNLIVSSGTANHEFTFLIVPKSIKESLKVEK